MAKLSMVSIPVTDHYNRGNEMLDLWRMFALSGLRQRMGGSQQLQHIQFREFFEMITRLDLPNASKLTRARLRLVFTKVTEHGRRVEQGLSSRQKLRAPCEDPVKGDTQTPLKYMSYDTFLDALALVSQVAFPHEHRTGEHQAFARLVQCMIRVGPAGGFLPWGFSHQEMEAFQKAEEVLSLMHRFRDALLSVFNGFSVGARRPHGGRTLHHHEWVTLCNTAFHFGQESPTVLTRHQLSMIFVWACNTGPTVQPAEITFTEFTRAVCAVAFCAVKGKGRRVVLTVATANASTLKTKRVASHDHVAVSRLSPGRVVKYLLHRMTNSPPEQGNRARAFIPLRSEFAKMHRADGSPGSYLVEEAAEVDSNGHSLMRKAGFNSKRPNSRQLVDSDQGENSWSSPRAYFGPEPILGGDVQHSGIHRRLSLTQMILADENHPDPQNSHSYPTRFSDATPTRPPQRRVGRHHLVDSDPEHEQDPDPLDALSDAASEENRFAHTAALHAVVHSNDVTVVDSLDGTWIEYYDEERGIPYFYNLATHQTQWRRPSERAQVVKYQPRAYVVSRGGAEHPWAI